jgi:hypothetical protein
MNAPSHTEIRRLGVLLAIATALTALLAAPALGQGRPAADYYAPQDVQRMSDSWAARGGVLTNVPSSSYYLPQQIETMSQGWAARGGLLPASAALVTTGHDDFDWGDFGLGAGASFGLALLLGGIAAGLYFGRRDTVPPRTVS